MLSLWNNPFLPEMTKSDSRMSTKSFFDRIFEETWGTMLQDLYRVPVGLGIETRKNEDGSLNISIDVPGIQEQDITIEVSDGVIYIEGERKTNTSSFKVKKSFSIPEDYDSENIVAELKNGILSLKLLRKQLPTKEVKKIPLINK